MFEGGNELHDGYKAIGVSEGDLLMKTHYFESSFTGNAGGGKNIFIASEAPLNGIGREENL